MPVPTTTCLIADDERPARRIIRQYLDAIDGTKVVAECANGLEAVRDIQATAPDLVFLDVQMPGLNGFEVLGELENPPPIVFSTAYDQYAVQAFEVNAVDYLLKPYDRERFHAAVDRALRASPIDRAVSVLRGAAAAQSASPLSQTSSQTSAPDSAGSPPEATRTPDRPLRRLLVQHQDRHVMLGVSDIRWIEAAGDYARIHTADGSYLSSQGLGALAERLSGDLLARVHRSAIIAIDALRDVQRDGSGGFHARLDDGTEVRVSRTYAEVVRQWMV